MGAPYIYIYIYIYDISSLRVKDLTFILLTWRKWCAPNNASREQMGFNSGFKGLNSCHGCINVHEIYVASVVLHRFKHDRLL